MRGGGGMHRLLAFFGSDLEGRGPEYLQQADHEGYALLALDFSAAARAAAAAVPYTLCDDWVGTASRLSAIENAAIWEREWFEAARQEFTWEGICWPDFDRHAMHWFWLEVAFADLLAEAFGKEGITDLRFFQDEEKRPGVYVSPADIYSAAWEEALRCTREPPDTAQEPGQHEKPDEPLYRRVFMSARARARRILTLVPQPPGPETGAIPAPVSLPKGAIVLAFNVGEAHRFTPIIEELYQGVSCPVAAVTLSHDPTRANAIGAEWPVPVAPGPALGELDAGSQAKFSQAYSRLVAEGLGEPWHSALRRFEFHFEYYRRERWPTLANGFRAWQELWKEARPQAVLVSSLYDAESQLPAAAARPLGIPTFAIPHGATQLVDDLLASDYVLYGYRIQEMAWQLGGIKSSRVKPCHGIVTENEYPSSPNSELESSGGLRLLGLTNPTGFERRLLPTLSLRAQLEALRAVNRPPADIAARINLRIKPHPNNAEFEIFALADRGLERAVVPPNADLRSALQDSDLVVAINYLGSALLHALRLGKPVVLLWVDELFLKAPGTQVDLFMPGCQLARTPEEFWDVVRKFFTDERFAQAMRLKAQEFCRGNLDDSDYPTISEVIETTLESHKTGMAAK